MSRGKRWIDPQIKEQFLDWLMTPPGEREPATKTEFAEQFGVSPKTLYNWEREPKFQEKLFQLRVEWGNRWYPDILAKLMDIVLNGPPAQSVAASKVLLSHIDVSETKEAVRIQVSEELQKRMKELAEELGYEVIE